MACQQLVRPLGGFWQRSQVIECKGAAAMSACLEPYYNNTVVVNSQ